MLGLAGLAAGTAAALAPLALAGPAGERYVIGAKDFTESYILADLMADRVRTTGARTQLKEDLGSAFAYDGLRDNEIDAYVDYSGTLWANVLHRTDNPGRAAVLDQLTAALWRRDRVTVLGSLGFEDAYALAMRREAARRLGIASIADLAERAGDLALGADLEFLSRPEWVAVRDAYGLKFRREVQYQPTFMYRSIMSGQVDVISAFSSDGRIAADDLVLLADPRHALPPYDAVVLLAPRRAHDARLIGALKPLIGRISLGAMQQANLSVDRDADKATPGAAARALEAKLGF
jgi:osmoprotectant transport system permease protein